MEPIKSIEDKRLWKTMISDVVVDDVSTWEGRKKKGKEEEEKEEEGEEEEEEEEEEET